MKRLGWFHQEAQLPAHPFTVFSLVYPLPFPALVPAHYSHSTCSHGVAQHFCWNECSWNASPPGAGWQTKNEQGDLRAADSSPRVWEGQVGCSGAISIVLSCIWHLFATGWFLAGLRHPYPFWCSRSSGTGSIHISASPSHCYHMQLLSGCCYCG